VKYIRFIVLLLVVALLGLFFYVFPKIITIKKFQCVSQYGPCSQSTQDLLIKEAGKNLLTVKKDLIQVFKDDSTVKEYSINYQIPDILKINLIEKKAINAIYSLAQKKYALADNEGLIIRILDETNLPVVEISGPLKNVGEKVGVEENNALQIINLFYNTYFVKRGSLINESLETFLPDGKKVIFPLDRDASVLFGSLKLVMDVLNSDTKEPKIENDLQIKEIDLRFKNPVLR
jgi:hypothetical protein